MKENIFIRIKLKKFKLFIKIKEKYFGKNKEKKFYKDQNLSSLIL